MRFCMGCMNQIADNILTCPHCGYNERTAEQQSYYMKPGSILSGKYIVGRSISYADFTVKYIGLNAETNQKVFINEYLPSDFSTRSDGDTEVTIYSGDALEQFSKGLQKYLKDGFSLLKAGNCQGILNVQEVIEENDTGYIITEYFEGDTLKNLMEEGKRFNVDNTVKMIKEVLVGLSKVHLNQVVHLDISPASVFITADGHAKLMDFASARYVTSVNSKSLAVILKQGYAAEEQYRSGGVKGPWTDVYGIAAVMYKMLTNTTPQESIDRALEDVLEDVSRKNSKVPENIENALMNALNVQKEKRTPSAAKFLEELNSKDVKRIKVKKDRNKTGKVPVAVKALVGVACLALVGGGVLLVRNINSNKQSTEVTKSAAKFNMSENVSLEDFEKKWTDEYKLDLSMVHYIYRYDSEEAKAGNETVKVIDYNSDILDDGKDVSKIQEELKDATFDASDNPLITIEIAGSIFIMDDTWLNNYICNDSDNITYIDNSAGIEAKEDSEDIPYGKVIDITAGGSSIAKTTGNSSNTLEYDKSKSSEKTGAFMINDDTQWVLDASKDVEITIGNGDYFWLDKKSLNFDDKKLNDITFKYGKHSVKDKLRPITKKDKGYYSSDYYSFDISAWQIIEVNKPLFEGSNYSSKENGIAFNVVKTKIKSGITYDQFKKITHMSDKNISLVYQSGGEAPKTNSQVITGLVSVKASEKADESMVRLPNDKVNDKVFKKDDTITLYVKDLATEKPVETPATYNSGDSSGTGSSGTGGNPGTGGSGTDGSGTDGSGTGGSGTGGSGTGDSGTDNSGSGGSGSNDENQFNQDGDLFSS